METTRAADLVQREAATLAALLEPTSLEAQVPGCPGWRLVDLARHTGGVHRWATTALATPPDGSPGEEPAGPEDDADVRTWFTDGAAALSAALRTTPSAHPCWTFAATEAPATAAFWARRQVLETALHRWDAQTAVGAPDPGTWLAADVAAAGVAEVVDVLLPRQVRLGRTPALPGAVALEDDGALPPGSALLAPAGLPAGGAGAVVVGPSPVLLLLLWRRTTLGEELAAGRLRVTGDLEVAERVLAAALTP